jgi:hypothetical protein
MGGDKFSWKSLFVNEDSDSNDRAAEKQEESTNPLPKNKFPEIKQEEHKFKGAAPSLNRGHHINQEVLNSVLDIYERGFDSLNLPGYDFYEYFKSIMAVDPDNNQSYSMAFQMAKTIDSKLTKETLLSKAEFYITEINKVHQNYEVQGKNKKIGILELQKKEKADLENEILRYQIELKKIQQELNEKTKLLGDIDTRYTQSIVDIDDKLMANDISKDTMLNTIGRVVSGIKNNVK